MHSTLYIFHALAAYLSIGLFVARGFLMFNGSEWFHHRALRAIPSAVDTVLLVSALALMFVVQQYPFVDHWLTAKVIGLVGYIVLGAIALGSGERGRNIRVKAYLGAILVFGYVLLVSITRQPLVFL
ncbi:SirB2 family protein [Halorhodospira halochloris]|uniref:SirB2 family protein n=1 Tax=Halorhodospira halochloris TaxID=1052 RepID=UPI001EE87AFC|nr:SirB2 family protein [Halorhodospira halochloris]MCG5530304.1 SirB2 family protein [Halorhodospira halochloris]MCG5547219.1 SirB2 family protein [Halorhodospira halochloris]